jgi:hypothetical protein
VTPRMRLSDILIDMGAPGNGASASLRWLADWLPDAECRQLSKEDIARIDAYAGGAGELHELLTTVLPLARPMWFESMAITHGIETIAGYGAVPMGDDRIEIGWTCYAPAHDRIVGPFGPAAVTTRGMERPADIADESWQELRSAAGVIIRALLLKL